MMDINRLGLTKIKHNILVEKLEAKMNTKKVILVLALLIIGPTVLLSQQRINMGSNPGFAEYPPTRVSADGVGNIYVVVDDIWNGDRYIIRSYDKLGNLRWEKKDFEFGDIRGIAVQCNSFGDPIRVAVCGKKDRQNYLAFFWESSGDYIDKVWAPAAGRIAADNKSASEIFLTTPHRIYKMGWWGGIIWETSYSAGSDYDFPVIRADRQLVVVDKGYNKIQVFDNASGRFLGDMINLDHLPGNTEYKGMAIHASTNEVVLGLYYSGDDYGSRIRVYKYNNVNKKYEFTFEFKTPGYKDFRIKDITCVPNLKSLIVMDDWWEAAFIYPYWEDKLIHKGVQEFPFIVYKVIHDPPGDRSYSYISSAEKITGSIGLSVTYESETTTSFGAEAEAAGNSAKVSNSTTVGVSAGVQGEFTWSTTTNQTLNSATVYSDADYMGPGHGDVFMGESMEIEYEVHRYFDPANGKQPSIYFLFRPVPNSGSGIYVYSVEYIRNTLYAIDSTWAEQVLSNDIGLDNRIDEDEQEYVEHIKDISKDGGSGALKESKTKSTTKKAKFTTTLKISNKTTAEMSMGVDVPFLAKAKASAGIEVKVGLSIGASISASVTHSNTVGYSLSDDDPTDIFKTKIYLDKRYGSYLFITDHDRSKTSAPQEHYTIPADSIPPVISNLQPLESETVSDKNPFTKADLRDPDNPPMWPGDTNTDPSGINLNAGSMYIDGNIVPHSISSSQISYQPSVGLLNGLHTVDLTVKDKAGNRSQKNWDFVVNVLPGMNFPYVSSAVESRSIVITGYLIHNTVPESTSSKLYYRRYSSSNPVPFSEAEMNRYTTGIQNQSKFQGVIPGDSVRTGYLEYYLLASDGMNTARDPGIEGESYLVEVNPGGLAPPVDSIFVTVEASVLLADGSSSTTVTASLFDIFRNPAPDSLIVYFQTTAGTVLPDSAFTTNGQAVATITALKSSTTLIGKVMASTVEGLFGDTEIIFVGTESGNTAPYPPYVLSPAKNEEVNTTLPILSVLNSYDPDSAAVLTYEFQVYDNSGLTSMVDSVSGIQEGERSTSWTVENELQPGQIYWWIARAYDGIYYSAWTESHFYVSESVTGVESMESGVPTEFTLYNNYPNPFNPVTTIDYDLPKPCHVKLEVFNFLGQHVVTLVDKKQVAGRYSIHWDASQFSSGVYLLRLQAGYETGFQKITFLK